MNPEKVEENNIDKLSNQVKELTTYLKKIGYE